MRMERFWLMFIYLTFCILTGTALILFNNVLAQNNVETVKQLNNTNIDTQNSNFNNENFTRLEPTDLGKTQSFVSERVIKELGMLSEGEIKDYPLTDL